MFQYFYSRSVVVSDGSVFDFALKYHQYVFIPSQVIDYLTHHYFTSATHSLWVRCITLRLCKHWSILYRYPSRLMPNVDSLCHNQMA